MGIRYNVYLHTNQGEHKFYYNLNEHEIQNLADAYRKGDKSILIPPHGRFDLEELQNIAIYENVTDTSDLEIEKYLESVGDKSNAFVTNKRFKDLEKFGREVNSFLLNPRVKSANFDWPRIHKTIQLIAEPRFSSGHFADAVEASFKEINDLIKQQLKKDTGSELDGADLMRKVFSANQPIYKLADNSTDSGKNIQRGYMDIFAGVMTGIRNPKAHANMIVDKDEAWDLIVIASHLLKMWDKRII